MLQKTRKHKPIKNDKLKKIVRILILTNNNTRCGLSLYTMKNSGFDVKKPFLT